MKKIIFLTAILMTIGTFASCRNNTSKKTSEDGGKGTVIELTSEEFKDKVYDINSENLEYLGSRPAMVDFTASWCGPCRQITPILEELASEYEGEVVIYKVDVDECRDVASAFGIKSIPAILYIPANGEPQMTVGSRGKAKFKEEIEKFLLTE